MNMFCYQCQEALKNEGCLLAGACGKSPDVAALQDLLLWSLKGLSFYGVNARDLDVVDPQADLLVAQGLFATITNVNFDPQRIADLIRQVVVVRDRLKARFETAYRAAHGQSFDEVVPDMAAWTPTDDLPETLLAKGRCVGILADEDLNPDVRSLRDLVTYGLKGLAAYTDHAAVLDTYSAELLAFLQEGLLATAESRDANELVALAMKCGEMGVQAMAVLDQANTGAYGNPEITSVNLGVKPGPAILISGHDLRDLDELLQQTEGKGVNVYTHGEMLPAHAYPAFKKYPHFVGNYGGAWYRQPEEFESFNGAVLMTTNCMVKPRNSYKDRIFTTGLVGYPGVRHVADRQNGSPKDFSPVIEKALQSGSPQELEQGSIPVGFAHASVMSVADKVVEAVQAGAIKRFVVMAGCDGRQSERQYYTDIATALPKDTVILTAGCAKYRYNKLDLGDIGGIPRVLDAGQCNDSYSLVVIAQKLAEVFGVSDINDLPISYDIAWYEQKAVIVLLALLYLGVKKIRLGPTIPAFLSPNVVNVLVEKFDIMPVGSVEADVEAMLAGR